MIHIDYPDFTDILSTNPKFTGCVIDEGDKAHYLNGKLHREGGPAYECANGTKEWYLNGECHRTDGPAIEYINGAKFWYLNGLQHREDGPAIECANGNKYWHLNGKSLTEEEYLITIRENKLRAFLRTVSIP